MIDNMVLATVLVYRMHTDSSEIHLHMVTKVVTIRPSVLKGTWKVLRVLYMYIYGAVRYVHVVLVVPPTAVVQCTLVCTL
jgi:hypothetical protein